MYFESPARARREPTFKRIPLSSGNQTTEKSEETRRIRGFFINLRIFFVMDIWGSVARIWFAHSGKDSYSSTCCCDELKSSKRKHAVVAQLVEHHLAKVDVASSSLVNRSTKAPRFASGLFRCLRKFWQVLALEALGGVRVLRSFPR